MEHSSGLTGHCHTSISQDWPGEQMKDHCSTHPYHPVPIP